MQQDDGIVFDCSELTSITETQWVEVIEWMKTSV